MAILLGAAVLRSLATILSIKYVVPPTINHFTDDPELPQLDYILIIKRKNCQLRY